MTRKKLPKGFAAYDTADFLTNEARLAAYLEEVFAEHGDDPGYIAQAIGTVARARNMSKLAKDVGISREGLYKALSERGNPSFGTMLKVTRALGLKLTIERAHST